MQNKLKVYNTLTKKKEEFYPKEDNHVRMYVCGPTTYNFIHLGNARPIVVFDTIRRYLEYLGNKVTYVQNFTDVDDKIINRAKEEGEEPLNLAARFIKEYFCDAHKLNVKDADVHPKVSEHITEIINFVSGLINKGFAYEVEGDVYFSVKKFKDYGKLSGRSLDDLLVGARVEVDQRKKDPLDFALWKKSKEGEIGWESPWGKGRPGWHIECSTMSNKYLGAEFDIHGGGFDLIFPHHENEIAQTESLLDAPMCKYWLHNGFITINQEKMSKSLGNFFLLREILDKYESDIIRFYLLSTHYRSPLDFDDEKLEMARKGLERLHNSYIQIEYALERAGAAENGEELEKAVCKARDSFIAAMNDDFNTALAFASLFDLAREVNIYLKEEKVNNKILKKTKHVFEEIMGVMGIKFAKDIIKKDGLLNDISKILIKIRQNARESRDFSTADFIRDEMKQLGVFLEDTPQGTNFKVEMEAENLQEKLLDFIVQLRDQARTEKKYEFSDLIRDELSIHGVALKDTPQGTRWEFSLEK